MRNIAFQSTRKWLKTIFANQFNNELKRICSPHLCKWKFSFVNNCFLSKCKNCFAFSKNVETGPWSLDLKNVMLCAIWNHLHNLRNVKNALGKLLPLVKFQAKASNFTKSNTPPWVFITFFKLYKWYQIAQRISNIQCFQKSFFQWLFILRNGFRIILHVPRINPITHSVLKMVKYTLKILQRLLLDS